MAVALSSALREGIKAAHTMAENTGFVSSFLQGVVDLSSFRNLSGCNWEGPVCGWFTCRQRGGSTEAVVA